MTRWQIAIQSLKYYWRTNLAVALGVAAATAVLTGALIVGDSMRTSLRALTIERLGDIDEMIVSQGFFEADRVPAKGVSLAAPAIMFPGGTVDTGDSESKRRAGNVAVLGIELGFWDFGDESLRPIQSDLVGESVIINQALADDLQITELQVADGIALVTLRIPKQDQLPADSPLAKKDDLIESLVDLKVTKIVPTKGLGRFGLHPSQSDPLNIYVPIKLLQDSLSRTVLKHKTETAQANVLFIDHDDDAHILAESGAFAGDFEFSLEDYGLTLKRVTQAFDTSEFGGNPETVFDYWSLYSDRMVLSDIVVEKIQSKISSAKPVFTYLANDIRKPGTECGVPFSMVASIDLDDSFQPKSSVSGDSIKPLGANEIVLNEWTANDLEVKVGETLIVTYFEPETTHGQEVSREVELKLVDIARLTEPVDPFEYRRRDEVKPAVFEQAPTLANDPDLTPEVPGVTDAESIENWDLPFDTAERIRSEDDEYWGNHRTTPKAFVSLETGQKLWGSRFGQATTLRIPVSAGGRDTLVKQIEEICRNNKSALGIEFVPIKQQGLAASSGSTPFDVLFLALSMFVIGSALILVALLFRLAFQQRAAEVGILSATGFEPKQIRNIWLSEMLLVSIAGAILGVILGIGYAWFMILGLSTWWVGAISRPFLQMNLSPVSLTAGLLSGLLVCVGTIAWSLRSAQKQNVRSLLAGQIESKVDAKKAKPGLPWLPIVLFVVAIGLAVMATGLSGEAQAGSFMGAGFLVLAALLQLVLRWLRRPADNSEANSLKLSSLAIMNAKRNPLRSTLTIGLVAVAAFLIAAVSAFRLAPTEQGTAGFDWVAQSSQPVFYDLSSPAGQTEVFGDANALSAGTEIVSIRFKSGEDASCNNLYQSTQPRALGVPSSFVNSFDDPNALQFAWGGSVGGDEAIKKNAWHLLDADVAHAGTEEDPIPVILDKNTANYSLKIYLPGTVRKVEYDSGETFYFKAVGFLANTILQGSLIMSETDFESVFPTTAGYRYFLIRDGDEESDGQSSNIAKLEDQLGDQGFDARSAPQLLLNFMAVQNTYLSTFQTLGALGLLLGTFGLAAVQLRSVLERKTELGLMRAVGFSQGRLGRMVLLENTFLLVTGLLVGIGAALFTTLPHWLVGNASVPWLELGMMFAAITIVGLLAGLFASRQIFKMPLLESLRA